MISNNNASIFLAGGGEMGRLTREKDWSATPLGPIDCWPQSLLTTLSIILNSKFPMFLFWGNESFCFYNDAYRPSLGIDGKHPSILGSNGKAAWGEIWEYIEPLILQVLGGGEATWSEDQLIPIYRNGQLEDVYWTFSYSPVRNESGKPAGVFVTCTETTEKILVLSQIKESKRELEFAIEAAELGTFDFNPKTNKFSANNRLKEWFGLASESAIDLQNALDVISEKDQARVREAIANSLQFSSGGKFETQYSIIHPVSKKEIVVHAKGIVSFGDNQTAFRLNGTLHDITEQKLFEKQLELQVEERTRELAQTVSDLAKTNKELESFAYISSHDLQEPLRKIQTFAMRILEKEHENLSDNAKDYFGRMQKAATRMQSLIDDLLAYSRTHKTDVKFEETDLNKLFDEVRQDLKEEIMQKHATIEVNGLGKVSVIPYQFRQLFYNIISNSLKFSIQGKAPHISVMAEVKSPDKFLSDKNENTAATLYCHLRISDNGIGFESQYNEKIFELFQRLHGQSKYTGTGIGLAIVKKIVENHHGFISASGEPDKGTVIDIYIPEK